MAERKTPPKYDLEIVEFATLAMAAELHPERLSVDGLLLKIVSDPDDDREVKVAARAIRNLRELGLFKNRDDEIVELTPAALRAVALLT